MADSVRKVECFSILSGSTGTRCASRARAARGYGCISAITATSSATSATSIAATLIA